MDYFEFFEGQGTDPLIYGLNDGSSEIEKTSSKIALAIKRAENGNKKDSMQCDSITPDISNAFSIKIRTKDDVNENILKMVKTKMKQQSKNSLN